MVGCCAVGCTNSSYKGFYMKHFPRDPNRRKAWAAKVNRANWSPTNNSCLCEVHFSPGMFEENRADGRRMLRWNAIPTIFSDISQLPPSKPPTKRCYPKKKTSISQENQSTPVNNMDSTVDPNLLILEYTKEDFPSSSLISNVPSSNLRPQEKRMPGCCAAGCTNSDAKGFLMKRFPRHPERRRIWAEKIKRENWTPTDSSCLCEIHFTEDMFQQTSDGKKMLKHNAIPSIFLQPLLKKSRKPPLKRSLDSIETPEDVLDIDNAGTAKIRDELESINSGIPSPTLLPQTKCSELKVPVGNKRSQKPAMKRSSRKKKLSLNTPGVDSCEPPEQILDVGNAETVELGEKLESTPNGPLLLTLLPQTKFSDLKVQICEGRSQKPPLFLRQLSVNTVVLDSIETPEKIRDVGNAGTAEIREKLECTPSDPPLILLPQTKCSNFKVQIIHGRSQKRPLRRILPKKESSVNTVVLDSIKTPEQVLDVYNAGTCGIKEKLESTASCPPSQTFLPQTKCCDLKQQISDYNRIFKKMSLKIKILKTKLRQTRQKLKTLCEADVHLKSLKKVFSDDQVKFLINGHNSHWSNTSLMNAIKIKLSCGQSGYNELLKLNFPLPSLRTLRRRILSIKKK